jgi:putative transposase
MCVKYRRKILKDALDIRLKELVLAVAEKFGIAIVEQETGKDHIHILFSDKPSITPSTFVNILKSATSRRLRNEFPDVMKKHLWGGKFWSESYFLASTGQVTFEALKRYVESQKEE